MNDEREQIIVALSRIEHKVDALSGSVDQRFDAVDRRFEAVQGALIEQRHYTEFAFDQTIQLMSDRFKSVDDGFKSVDDRFKSVDDRFKSVDDRFNRLERKLDQFIDTQSKTK
jgi:hypothetical protein